MSAATIPMQATIGGLSAMAGTGGETVLGVLDVNSGVLLVDMAVPVRAGAKEMRHNDCAVCTNNPGSEDYDHLFTEADIRDAINDYFAFAGRSLLVLDEAVNKHNPSSKIEPDGIDDRGRKYRVAPDISNGQLAVIVLCWFATRQSGFARQLTAFDDMMDTTVTSVGLPGSVGDKRVFGYAMGGKLALGADGWPI